MTPLPTHIERLVTACPVLDHSCIRHARKRGLRRIIVNGVVIIERRVK